MDPRIFERLRSQGTVDVLVSFQASNLTEIRNEFVTKHKRSDRTTRLVSFHQTLTHHAKQTQLNLVSELKALGKSTLGKVKFIELWVTNQLIIRKANEKVIQKLHESCEVAKVRLDRVFIILPPKSVVTKMKNVCLPIRGKTWGVAAIEASKIWNKRYDGQGIVLYTFYYTVMWC